MRNVVYNYLEDVDVDRKMILKLSYRNKIWGCEMYSLVSEWVVLVAVYERSNDPCYL